MPDVNSTTTDLPSDHVNASNLMCLLMLGEVILLAVTWPLWVTIDQFPAVPLFAVLKDVPVTADILLYAILLLAVAVFAVSSWRNRRAVLTTESRCHRSLLQAKSQVTAIISGVALVLLNQHRLQPWHWLFLLLLIQNLLVTDERRIWMFRLTVASVYIFAAVSRFGPQLEYGMTRQILSVLLNTLRAGDWLQQPGVALAAASAMALFEFLTGCGLLLARFRRVAVISAVAMHGLLIVVLSPFGLNHHWGVLIWNLLLLLAVPLLFWPRGQVFPDGRPMGFRESLLTAFVVLFPLSGLFAIADNWPSWQLYSPRPEVVRVFIHADAVEQLPKELRSFVGVPKPLDVWCPLRIDRWSLATTQTPIYPEDRFQLAVATGLLRQVASHDQIQFELDRPQTPLWWRRESEVISAADVDGRASQFLFNGIAIRGPWATLPIAD